MGLPRLIKVIAVTQVWGAATGTWFIVPQLAEWGPGTRLVVPLLLIALLCFYTLLGVTALLVLRNRKAAIFWLAAAQLPQLILVQTPDFLYRVLAGAFVVLRAGGGGLGIDIGVTSTATIRWGDLGLSTGFGLNILAAATLWYLAVVDPWAEYEKRRFPMRAEDQVGHPGSPNVSERPNKRLKLPGPTLKGSVPLCANLPIPQGGALAPAGARPAA